jgi:hypothetical protein
MVLTAQNRFPTGAGTFVLAPPDRIEVTRRLVDISVVFIRQQRGLGQSLSSNPVELCGKCPVLIAANIQAYPYIFFQFFSVSQG